MEDCAARQIIQGIVVDRHEKRRTEKEQRINRKTSETQEDAFAGDTFPKNGAHAFECLYKNSDQVNAVDKLDMFYREERS